MAWTLPRVVDCEGEHSSKPQQKIVPELLVKTQDDFRVRPGIELISLFFEEPALVLEVVCLTVIDDPHGFFRIAHGLVSGRAKVDDREAAHAERDDTIGEDAPIIGSSMVHGPNHACHGFFVWSAPYATDAAHAIRTSLRE